MTHFLVTVVVTEKRLAKCGNLDGALAELLAPFEESPPEGSPFLKFIEDKDGEEKSRGRRGYFGNPNAKWDWFVIGGRWSGFYPLKPGAKKRLGESSALYPAALDDEGGDAVHVHEIDFDAVVKRRDDALEKFFVQYSALLAGESFRVYEGPRRQAMNLGLIRVEKGPAVAAEGEVILPWAGHVDDERRNWNDVARVATRDELLKLAECFSPISTYAALDDEGWGAPGEMGWFGCSDESPEAFKTWHLAFAERYIKPRKLTDLLVAVDCHI